MGLIQGSGGKIVPIKFCTKFNIEPDPLVA
jgi:hypothetical protein